MGIRNKIHACQCAMQVRRAKERKSRVVNESKSPCHDSDTALSFSFPFLDGGIKRLGELDAELIMLSEDSLRGREGVGLPDVEMLSRGEVTG